MHEEPTPPPRGRDPHAEYLAALRAGSSAAQAALEGRHAELAGDFAALRSAWDRLGDRLDVRPSSGATPESGAGAASGAALGATRFERLRARGARGARYELGTEIARGGMGSIRSVWDADLRRRLAMKVMLRPEDRDPTAASRPPDQRLLTRFLEEAQITAQLDHPGILPVHEIGVDDEGRLFFTMPLVQGRHLGEVLRLARERRDGWNLTRAVGVLLKVTEAVAFAHARGVVHRDLKPENVMVGRFGETYVMDWGLARVLDAAERLGPDRATDGPTRRRKARDERVRTDRGASDTPSHERFVTHDGDIVGTPGYMAPEQARGRREEIGPPADIFALGSILYELLAGHAPHLDPESRRGDVPLIERILEHDPVPLRKLAPEAPEELVAIASKAMARSPDQRYASAEALSDDLRAWLEGRVVSAYATGTWAEMRKWVARNKLLAVAYGLVALSLLTGGAVFVRQQQANLTRLQEEQSRTELARTDAENARVRAEAEKAAARLREYAARVGAADLALRSSDIEEARGRLDAAPPELRGFEWYHLAAQLDTSLGLAASVGPNVVAAHFLGTSAVAVLRELSATELELSVWDLPAARRRFGRVVETNAPEALPSWASATAGVALRPDGGVVAVGLPGGELLLFSAQDPRHPPVALERRSDQKSDLLAWSGDGEWLVAGSTSYDRRGFERFAPARGTSGVAFAMTSRTPTSLAFDPRSARVMVGYEDGAVMLWRVVGADTDRPETVLVGHDSAITATTFTPDASRIVTSARDGTVRLFESEGGRLLTVVRRAGGAPERIAFASDYVVGASADGELTLWHERDGHRANVQRGLPARCVAIAGAPGEDRLWTLARDGSVQSWDARSGPAVTEARVRAMRAASALEFSPDGSRLLLMRQQRPEVWDAHTLEPLLTLQHGREAWGEAGFVAGGRRIVAQTTRGGVVVDTTSGNVLAQLVPPQGWKERFSAPMAIAHQRSRAVLLNQNGYAAVYDIESATSDVEPSSTFRVCDPAPQPAGLGASPAVASTLRLSDDGRLLAATLRDGSVVTFDVDRGEPLATLVQPRADDAPAAANPTVDARPRFAVDHAGTRVAVTLLDASGKPTQIAIFDPRSGERLVHWPAHRNPILAIRFDRSGTRLATGADDGVVRLWEAATGEPLLTLEAQERRVVAVTFSADGSRFATASNDGRLRIHETTSPRVRFENRIAQASARKLAMVMLGERAVPARESESVAEPVKRALDRITRLLADDPARLNMDAWDVVQRPGATRDEYQLALLRAEAAVRRTPDDFSFLRTLGVAYFRMGEYRKAIETLERSTGMQRRGGTRPEEWAVLALAHHALGETAAAETYRERFEQQMVDPYYARSELGRSFLAELDALDDVSNERTGSDSADGA